jgi:hypothetical protein
MMRWTGECDNRVLSIEDSHRIALAYFEDSFKHFKKLNHLVGMYQSRQEARDLIVQYHPRFRPETTL